MARRLCILLFAALSLPVIVLGDAVSMVSREQLG